MQANKHAILQLIESHAPHLQQLLDLFQPFVDILCLSPEDVIAETKQRAALGNAAEVFKQAVLGFYEVCDKNSRISNNGPSTAAPEVALATAGARATTTHVAPTVAAAATTTAKTTTTATAATAIAAASITTARCCSSRTAPSHACS